MRSLVGHLLLLATGAAALTRPPASTPPAQLSRRAALASSVLALSPLPSMAGDFFGYTDGVAMQQANKELETSPLIEELKRRTEANKAKNAATVREASFGAQGGVYDEAAGMKMVRYAGAGDALPVTRMLNAQQVKELESRGFELKCPSWGGACDIAEKRGRKAPRQ